MRATDFQSLGEKAGNEVSHGTEQVYQELGSGRQTQSSFRSYLWAAGTISAVTAGNLSHLPYFSKTQLSHIHMAAIMSSMYAVSRWLLYIFIKTRDQCWD